VKPININEDCQFLKDCTENSTKAMYNLIISKGAVQLWTKGIKPHSNWKISDVKRYFGMNGNAETLHSKLVKLHEVLTETENKRKTNEN
jgi:hypothetical protein